jgi:hypothetical protein
MRIDGHPARSARVDKLVSAAARRYDLAVPAGLLAAEADERTQPLTAG